MSFDLTWTRSKACWSVVYNKVGEFVLAESVAGLMSEVCPFLKEIKRRDRDPLRSLVRSK